MSGHVAQRIVVVRQGDVPIVNARLAGVLREAFPDHDVVDVDLLAELRRRRFSAALVLGAAAIEHGPALARGRTDPRRAVLTSRAFSRFARRVTAGFADGPAGRARFVLQSQSLFTADVPGVPHAVYTDHVHLANMAYPGFDRRRLLPTSYLRRESELYDRSAVILVRSTNIADVLQHAYGVDEERIAVVGVGPNVPVDAAESTVERAWHGGRIVFVGLDWERKGGPVLVEAFERIRDRHPTARLEIVGPDAPSGERPSRVHYHGRLPVDRVAALLDRADVFCLPTLAEPFGVVFVEAMLAGLPVVGTRLGAQPDFIVPGRTGELVPPNDPTALASALDGLLGDPARTKRMGRWAAASAAENYSWSSVADRIRRAIDAALDGSQNESPVFQSRLVGADERRTTP